MAVERGDWAAERAKRESVRAELASEKPAREAAEAVLRQYQLAHTWRDLERRLEEAKVGLCVELWEVGLRVEHKVFWATVNGLPPAAREDFFLRVDTEHVLQQHQRPESESEVVDLGGAGVAGVGSGQVQQQQRQQQQETEASRETPRTLRRMRHRYSSSSSSSSSLSLRWWSLMVLV